MKGRHIRLRLFKMLSVLFVSLTLALLLVGCAPSDDLGSGMVRPMSPDLGQMVVGQALVDDVLTSRVTVPEGRAMVLLYAPNRFRGLARERGFGANLNTVFLHESTGISRQINFTESSSRELIPLIVFPGQYRLRALQAQHSLLSSRVNEEQLEWDLSAGDIAVVRIDGVGWSPNLRELTHDAFLAESSATTALNAGMSPVRFDETQKFQMLNRFLAATDIEVELVNVCPVGSGRLIWSNAVWEGRFDQCVPAKGVIEYSDGSRLAVEWSIDSDRHHHRIIPKGLSSLVRSNGEEIIAKMRLATANDAGSLPAPIPWDIGQSRWPDGTGVLGAFIDGVINGQSWCFDVLSGEVCHLENGQRLTETGVQRRFVADILATEPGLSPSMTIDLLRQRQIEALLSERWLEFLQLDADLSTLGVDTGIEALYYTGLALSGLGRYEPALQRINAYLNIAGASGASYGQALSLFADLRPRGEAAQQRRVSLMRSERELRGRFCRAVQLQGHSLCGCREFPELAIALGQCV
jgi:hypothetical protein